MTRDTLESTIRPDLAIPALSKAAPPAPAPETASGVAPAAPAKEAPLGPRATAVVDPWRADAVVRAVILCCGAAAREIARLRQAALGIAAPARRGFADVCDGASLDDALAPTTPGRLAVLAPGRDGDRPLPDLAGRGRLAAAIEELRALPSRVLVVARAGVTLEREAATAIAALGGRPAFLVLDGTDEDDR